MSILMLTFLTLTVNITRIRRKLESLGIRDFIVTKKGLGYMV